MMYVCLDCKKRAVKSVLVEKSYQGVCDKCGCSYALETYIKLAEKHKARDIREICGDDKFDRRNLESK